MNKKLLLPLLLLAVWVLLYINLQVASDYIVDSLIGMEKGAHLTESVRFFIFEVPKVILLLVLIVFIVGILRTWITTERTRKALQGKSLFTGNVMAAILGIITPFCSCSAIPLFIGFVEAGIPLGVTFSFLIAAPMINEVAVILLLSMFGIKVTVIYVATGLFVAIFAGWLIGVLKMEKYVADWVFKVQMGESDAESQIHTLETRIKAGYETVTEIVGKIWVYILIGIAVGAGAHGFVPADYLSDLMSNANWYSVPLAIIIGIPLYSNAAGVIPIVSVLIEKGVSLGTALAFMMSVIGLSLPEIIILKKVLKTRLIVYFVGIVAIGIIIVGYVFNLVY